MVYGRSIPISIRYTNSFMERSRVHSATIPFIDRCLSVPWWIQPPPLNDPGAKLEVTLEPTFELQNGKLANPSPFVALYTQLQRFINFDQSLQLTNVWNTSAPSGTLTITKR